MVALASLSFVRLSRLRMRSKPRATPQLASALQCWRRGDQARGPCGPRQSRRRLSPVLWRACTPRGFLRMEAHIQGRRCSATDMFGWRSLRKFETSIFCVGDNDTHVYFSLLFSWRCCNLRSTIINSVMELESQSHCSPILSDSNCGVQQAVFSEW